MFERIFVRGLKRTQRAADSLVELALMAVNLISSSITPPATLGPAWSAVQRSTPRDTHPAAANHDEADAQPLIRNRQPF